MKPTLVSLLLTIASSVWSQDATPTLVIKGGRIFDPARSDARPLGQLWIAAPKVLGERPLDTPVPKGVPVIDASDGVVLPGLFDLHAHVSVHGGGMTFAAAIPPEENLETALLCGVTHVVDLHADQRTIFELRDRSRTDPQLARLWAAGAAFTVPNGHPTRFGVPSNEIVLPEDVAARFAALAPKKPDLVKLVLEHGQWAGLPEMPTLSDALARAVVDAAHERKLRAWSHVWSLAEAKSAVAAGVDALAHGVFLGKADAELRDAMVKNKTAYVPTLAVVLGLAHGLQKRPPYARDLVREVLHPDLAAFLNDATTSSSLLASPIARFAKGGEPLFLQNLKFLFDGQVPVGLGTDAGNPYTPHGPAALFEIELYVQAGLSPAAALRVATLGSAEVLGVADRFGSLAPGKEADAVIVRGDPLAAIGDVWNVREVVKAGVRVDREPARARNARRAGPREVVVIADAASQPPFGLGRRFEVSCDQKAGGRSTGRLRDSKGGIAAFSGELLSGFAYGPWTGIALFFDPDRKRMVDASALTGIRLELEGTARPLGVTVHCAAVTDFNVFATTVEPAAEARAIDVPFASLQQIGWGRTVAWTGKDLTGLALEYRASPAGPVQEGPVDLEVKSIRFY